MWLRRTTLTVIGVVAVLVGTGAANAFVVTFDDSGLTTGKYYFPGDPISSDGIAFTLSDYVNANGAIWVADIARLVNGTNYALSGNALAMTGMTASTTFATAPQQLVIHVAGITGKEGALVINQDTQHPLRFDSSALQLDGSRAAGVNVAASAAGAVPTGYYAGTITLTGNITSIDIGGANLMIDNISDVVPEPATLGLLALGGLLAVRRRK